jgi:hypothetical protein
MKVEHCVLGLFRIVYAGCGGHDVLVGYLEEESEQW